MDNVRSSAPDTDALHASTVEPEALNKTIKNCIPTPEISKSLAIRTSRAVASFARAVNTVSRRGRVRVVTCHRELFTEGRPTRGEEGTTRERGAKHAGV